MKLTFILSLFLGAFVHCKNPNATFELIVADSRILHHSLNPQEGNLHFYYKNENEKRYKNAESLKRTLESNNQELLFCMNGGMFTPQFSPAGLYVENGKEINPINLVKNAPGNFHLMPNGVFLITSNNQAVICSSDQYRVLESVKYATQSGPMLLIDGEFHPAINEGSKNLHIRNGVGVMENGHLLFAMSTERINFFDFAQFFKKNGCKNALYLDGAISRTYLPEKKVNDTGGNFSVLIAEVRHKE